MTVQILVGDALSVLRDLPDGSVHCCVTSPPYWGLRAYKGDAGMIGLEPTFDEHLENLVAVFREVRRVLRSDGTLWMNYGDGYNTNTGSGNGEGLDGKVRGGAKEHSRWNKTKLSNLKPKDLMMMPARVALALQADGWWLRSEIIWHKPNPMPESCRDRPTSSHEKLFLMSKAARYFYDAEAVRVPVTSKTTLGMIYRRKDTDAFDNRDTFEKTYHPTAANLRNVWTIATHSFKDAHFATFPPALVEPCIKAGTSERGVCGACGAPWVREVAVSHSPNGRGSTGRQDGGDAMTYTRAVRKGGAVQE